MGAMRPMGLARYLPRFGWEPIVLIPAIPNESREDMKKVMNIIEISPFDLFVVLRDKLHLHAQGQGRSRTSQKSYVPDRFKQSLHHQLKTVLAFPDRYRGWSSVAINAADKIFRENRIDCILTTSFPWTTAVIGKKLKMKYRIPWVADFRDLWSQYHRYGYCALRRVIETEYEKHTLKHADHLTMVSEERAVKWKKIHPSKDITAITLGFDEEEFRNIRASNQAERLVLTYAGNIKENHFPEPLLNAIHELALQKYVDRRKIRLEFWGNVPERVVKETNKLGLADIVHFHPLIPRSEVLVKLKESHLLVLLNWDSPDELGVHPGKLFEYIGARVPILSIGRFSTVVEKVLNQTKSGVHITDYSTLKSYLIQAYDTFCRDGALPYHGKEEAIDLFTYSSIASQFARVLSSVSSSR